MEKKFQGENPWTPKKHVSNFIGACFHLCFLVFVSGFSGGFLVLFGFDDLFVCFSFWGLGVLLLLV